MQKLQQGMKNASAIFQERTEEALKSLTGIINFQDEVLVFGNNDSQCRKRLQAVRGRLKDKSFAIKETMSGTITTKLSLLGCTISSKGIRRDESSN